MIEARHELVRVRRQIVEEVRRAYAAFEASADALRQATDELVPLSELRVEQAEAAYRAGFADVTSVVLAEQQLLAARTTALELARELADARFRLERAAGGPGGLDDLPATRPATDSTATADAGEALQ